MASLRSRVRSGVAVVPGAGAVLAPVLRARAIALIARSGVFDQGWYELQSGRRFDSLVAAVRDYVEEGRRAGYSPHPLFEPSFVEPETWATRATDPLARHLLSRDRRVTRDPHPLFDVASYLRDHPAARRHPAGPLGHFLATVTDATPLPVPPGLLQHRSGAPTWAELRTAVFAGVRTWRTQQALRAPRQVHHHDAAAERRFRAEVSAAAAAVRAVPAVVGAGTGTGAGTAAGTGAGGGPLVSIVLPTWNRAARLRRAVESVQAQTLSGWELIVVDDGSTDDTAAVLEGLAAFDSRIRTLAVPHGGVSRARNAAIDEARADLLAFLDSDNTWEPEFLELMVAGMRTRSLRVAYSAMRLERASGTTWREFEGGREQLRAGNHIDLNVLVASTALVREVGGFDTTLRRTVDYDLVLSLADRAEPGYLPFVGAVYSDDDEDPTRISRSEPLSWDTVVRARHTLDWATATPPADLVGGRVSVLVPIEGDWRGGAAFLRRLTAEGVVGMPAATPQDAVGEEPAAATADVPEPGVAGSGVAGSGVAAPAVAAAAVAAAEMSGSGTAAAENGSDAAEAPDLLDAPDSADDHAAADRPDPAESHPAGSDPVGFDPVGFDPVEPEPVRSPRVAGTPGAPLTPGAPPTPGAPSTPGPVAGAVAAGVADLEILVLDRAGPRAASAVLAAYALLDPRITVRRAPAETGFPFAVDQLLLHASGARAVLVEPRMTLEAGWLPPLLRALGPGVLATSAVFLERDGSVFSAGAVFASGMTLPVPLLRNQPGSEALDAPLIEASAPQSPAIALRTADLLAVHGLDPLFASGLYDVDLGLRLAQLRPGRFVTVPTAVAIRTSVAAEDAGTAAADQRLFTERWRGSVPESAPAAWAALGTTLAHVRSRRTRSGGSAIEPVVIRAPRTVERAAFPALDRVTAEGVGAPGRGRPGDGVPSLRWAIMTGVPAGPKRFDWGDWYFAEALAGALRRLGQDAVLNPRDVPSRPSGHLDDVVLCLRGLSRFAPDPAKVNLLWVISHPDQVTPAEVAGFDRAFAASIGWSRSMSARAGVPVETLLQCTDPGRFSPAAAAAVEVAAEPVLFVGNSRRVRRPIVDSALAVGADLAVWGGGWSELLPPGVVRGVRVPNSELAAHYRRAGVVLNDHWDDMRTEGFLSNRLFDVVAAGGRVISDHVEGVETVFDGSVRTFDRRADLERLLRTDPDELFPDDAARLAAAARMAAEHSFDARAARLLTVVLGLLPS